MDRKPPLDLNKPRLLVRDFRRSWTFYTKTLGLRAIGGDGTPPYGEVGSPDRFVGRFLRTAMEGVLGPARPVRRATDAFALVFEVPDVDRTYARLRRAKVPILVAPTDRTLWGLRTVQHRAPDRNLVEL
ncbi:MAG: VOC family protein [Thermoplasmata archaeon]|nr:VOC family protein [Thermoplasmata archaeon]